MPVTKAPEPRNAQIDLPLDWESRTIDTIISALDDISELDDSDALIKWELAPNGKQMPSLYLLLSSKVVGEGRLPARHMHPVTGQLHPVISVGLASMPSGDLLEGQKLRDHVRNTVEHYLLRHGVRPTRVGEAIEPLRVRPATPEEILAAAKRAAPTLIGRN